MPKVWLALFFGYDGTNYYGMQYQKQSNINTIENQLITKLHSQDFLSTNNYSQLVKIYKWSRAARTDKGVHALINGISTIFQIHEKFYDEDNTLNKNKLDNSFKQLFADSGIVYHSFKRVINRFQMRQYVKCRVYNYICPKQYFKSKKMDAKQTLEKINSACKYFLGTHNFHNYSKNLKAKDPKANRYILEFKCTELNQNFFIFQVKGQSFIYHQIRKMIGSIVFIFINEYEPDFLLNTFFKNQLDIPLAPPYGLFLKTLIFDSYNKRNAIPQQIELDQNQESIKTLSAELKEVVISYQQSKWQQWYGHVKDNNFVKLEQDEPDLVQDDN